jgi:hypothetical protein
MRFFNTAGPVNPQDHYCLSALNRFDLNEILSLIQQKKYFILHAPRQTGKTSSLLALQEHIHQVGNYHCLYVNVEVGQTAREDVARGMRAILNSLSERARVDLKDTWIQSHWPDILDVSGGDDALNTVLGRWVETLSRPLVLLMDEIDALVGDTLISVLRQLRAGYTNRPENFPQSVILCGVRDVRDYRIHSKRENAVITGGSAFNIKAASLRLGNFTEHDVHELLQQHTQETGQVFEPEAVGRIWDFSRGQPWLVNALAYETCFNMESGRDRRQPIRAWVVSEAKDRLIARRETHLDQLSDKLKEDRVRRVLVPLLAGVQDPRLIPEDDVQYVADLGIVTTEGHIDIANPVYREIIPRELTYSTQLTISHQTQWYIKPDGRLNLNKLLSAFQEFFREHSEHWMERFAYREAGPQLLLQAFLQRIVNSGGRVEREYGLGRMRTDLLVVWPLGKEKGRMNETADHPVQKAVIELKILYKSLERTISDGLAQTWEYVDRSGAEEAHLVIFDRRPGVSWEQKIFQRSEMWEGHFITVWGM